MRWRFLVLALLIVVAPDNWRWPTAVVLSVVLGVDVVVSWIGLLPRLTPQTPKVPEDKPTEKISSAVPLPPDIKSRAAAVRERLRTDRCTWT